MNVNVDNIIFSRLSKHSVTVGTSISTNHNAISDITLINETITLPEFVFVNGNKMLVKQIGVHSFSFITSGLKAITIPNTVESIFSHAFWRCESLINMTFAPGSRVKTLGFKFIDMVKITTLHLPATVQEIADQGIYNCDQLKVIYFCGSNPINNSVFHSTPIQSIFVHSGYPIEFFGGIPVSISDDFLCSSVIYQGVFTFMCSISHCANILLPILSSFCFLLCWILEE